MSLHHNIQFNSEEFLAIINNDIHYVKNHFSLYEPLKDYWLTVASFYSNLEMNEFFVSKGANPHFNNNENFTNAIYQNKLELVKFYASHNCVLLKNNEEHFGGAILDAVRHNNLDILKYLIDLGCDIHLNNDFAFNVGIAENSFDCVRIVHNFDMSYHPDNNNIQNMIDCNYYYMLDYILKLTPTPFSFDFSTQVDYLFLKGKREMFDLFVSYGFVNEKIFNESFHSMICYFTEQADLFQHLKNHYKDWFTKANNQYIQPSKIKSFFEFFLTQNNQNTTLEYIIYHIHGLKEFICIEKLIKEEPYFISFVLLKNIKKYNNIELLAHFYQPEFIHNEQILSILDKSLPQLVECDFFNELLDIVFQESSYSSFHNVNKFHSYSKLRKLSHKNPSCKKNKI